MSKQKKGIILAISMVLVIGILLGAYFILRDKPVEGEKTITVFVDHLVGEDRTLKISTDAEFLREALEQEQGLIAGDESEFGLFVKTVDGETADDAEQQWWCFTKGGENVDTGVDSTVIADGDKFEITMTVGW